MSFLPLLLDLVFSQKRPAVSGNSFARALGLILLVLGAIIGLYQLFQMLVPDLTLRETGMVMGALLMTGGAILLFMGRTKTLPNPVNDVIETTTNTLKNLDLGSLISKNSSQVLVVALIAGFVLSQLGHLGTLKRVK